MQLKSTLNITSLLGGQYSRIFIFCREVFEKIDIKVWYWNERITEDIKKQSTNLLESYRRLLLKSSITFV